MIASPPNIYDVVQDVVHSLDPNLDIVSIALTPSAPAITGVATQQMVATATMQDGSQRVVTAQVTWASATTAKATISAAGLITGVAAGTSVITAALAGKVGTATVTVS